MALSDKTLTCVECGMILPSRLASKNSSLREDSPTNPSGVLRIVRLVGASSEDPEKCIKSCAQSAVLTLRSPLFPVTTDQSTVAIASAK